MASAVKKRGKRMLPQGVFLHSGESTYGSLSVVTRPWILGYFFRFFIIFSFFLEPNRTQARRCGLTSQASFDNRTTASKVGRRHMSHSAFTPITGYNDDALNSHPTHLHTISPVSAESCCLCYFPTRWDASCNDWMGAGDSHFFERSENKCGEPGRSSM